MEPWRPDLGRRRRAEEEGRGSDGQVWRGGEEGEEITELPVHLPVHLPVPLHQELPEPRR